MNGYDKFFTGKEKFSVKKPISNIGEYFNIVDVAKKYIFKDSLIWYRGNANKVYKLTPSLYRYENYSFENEVKMRNDFIDKAKGFVNFSHFSNFEWYFLMQHYGLPTRLLDWTEGYLIALFFALRLGKGDNEHTDPCVWLINPNTLNEIIHGEERLFRIDGDSVDKDKQLVDQYFNFKKDKDDQNPIAISSTYSNERILRQKGCFTIHGTKSLGIEDIYRRNRCNEIVQININRKYVPQMVKELEHTGVSESSIFPDLEGLSREIKTKYLK